MCPVPEGTFTLETCLWKWNKKSLSHHTSNSQSNFFTPSLLPSFFLHHKQHYTQPVIFNTKLLVAQTSSCTQILNKYKTETPITLTTKFTCIWKIKFQVYPENVSMSRRNRVPNENVCVSSSKMKMMKLWQIMCDFFECWTSQKKIVRWNSATKSHKRCEKNKGTSKTALNPRQQQMKKWTTQFNSGNFFDFLHKNTYQNKCSVLKKTMCFKNYCEAGLSTDVPRVQFSIPSKIFLSNKRCLEQIFRSRFSPLVLETPE